MFIGHYGLGFVLKRKCREIPLWVLFLSVQLMDIVAFILVFFGVERAAYENSVNPFFRNSLDLPYSHSLAGAFVLSAAVYLILVSIKRRSWALVAALCVLSHWVIDLVVHTPDLSIFFGYLKTGLGLWNYPYLSFGLEVALVFAGWLMLGYVNPVSLLLLFMLVGGFTGMVFGQEPESMRGNEALRTMTVLAPTMLFVVLAHLTETIQRRRASRAGAHPVGTASRAV